MAHVDEQNLSDARTKLQLLLEHCIRVDASDLHITPGSPPIVRVHGELLAVPNQALLEEWQTRRYPRRWKNFRLFQ